MLLCSFQVTAQPEQGSEIIIAGSILNFGYQEFKDTGDIFNREDGYIPGLVLGIVHTSDRWRFAGNYSFHGGDVHYTGETNTGIPITTQTIQNIYDLALHAEYWLQTMRGFEYALFLGAGYHQWDRNIQATSVNGTAVSGLFETYTWWSGFMGVKAIWYESGNESSTLEIRLLQIISPSIYVKFNGSYDNTSLALGERMGSKFLCRGVIL